jgi:tetratricopeptide (TPR) repeat protein
MAKIGKSSITKKKTRSVPPKSSKSVPKVKSSKATLKKAKKPSPGEIVKGKGKAKSVPKITAIFSKSHNLPPRPVRHGAEKIHAPEEMISIAAKNAASFHQKSSLVKQYETAVKMVFKQEYEKARETLEKIINSLAHDKDVLERARSLLKVCMQKLSVSSTILRSTEELYNYGVTLMNQGQYEEAQENFHKALRADPKSDFVLYAIAVNLCRAGNSSEALNYLKLAIQAKPANRFIARNDSDFEPIAGDPRFIALIH